MPYLGNVDLDKRIADSANLGKPFVLSSEENSEKTNFENIINEILSKLS